MALGLIMTLREPCAPPESDRWAVELECASRDPGAGKSDAGAVVLERTPPDPGAEESDAPLDARTRL